MVLRVPRVQQAMLVLQDSLVQMVHQDIKDTQVPQEHQERVVRMEGQDPWDHLAPLVQSAPLDLKAIQVFLAHLVQLAYQLRVFLVPMVHLEFQGQGVMMVFQAQLALLVHLANQERWSTTMRRACQSSPMRL